MNINRMTVKEFRELGYLQEVNRCFLHPLGLALEVVIDDDGEETFGGVWDYRDDPEGMRYGDHMISGTKAARIEQERRQKAAARVEALGYEVQPAS